MNKVLSACLLSAAAALPTAHADVHTSRGSLGVRLVITSVCSTQYTLFGTRAISPISVVCSPGATPFMTFSSILYGVAAGPNEQGTVRESSATPFATAFAEADTNTTVDGAAAETSGPLPPGAGQAFNTHAPAPIGKGSLTGPLKASRGQTTEVVHVTF